MISAQESYDFVLYRSLTGLDDAAVEVVGRSNAVIFRDRNEARGFRVSPSTGGFWKIVWSSRGDDDENFCELSGGRGRVLATTKRAYRRSDLCGAPANDIGFRDPGAVHEVVFACRNQEALEYTCGSSSTEMSVPRIFRCPTTKRGGSTSLVVFGNLGRSTKDASISYPPAATSPRRTRLTTDLLTRMTDVDVVLHLGNLAYAGGYGSAWDDYLDEIEPFASKFPYAPLLGTEELENGECGVPAKRLFTSWTSFDVGLVHVVGLKDSWSFLDADLKNVDRKRTPWVVVAGHHRPVDIEPLLLRYGVDLCFWGHTPIYQRSCANGHCVGGGVRSSSNNVYRHPRAPIHFVFGTAGVVVSGGEDLDDDDETALRILDASGVGRIDVHNASHLDVAFIDNGANNTPGTILDFVSVVKSDDDDLVPFDDDPVPFDDDPPFSKPPPRPERRPTPDTIVLCIAGPLLLWVAWDSAKRSEWWSSDPPRFDTIDDDDDDSDDDDDDIPSHHQYSNRSRRHQYNQLNNNNQPDYTPIHPP